MVACTAAAKACANALELDSEELPSTAASSVVHSPSLGPDPECPDLVCGDLGATLGSINSGKTWKQWKPLQKQIEAYLSIGNLSHDVYLRSKMDACGWVLLDDLVNIFKLKQATVSEISAAVHASNLLQVSDDALSVRSKNPALHVAFAPRGLVLPDGPLSPSPSTTFCTQSLEDLYIPDEDLTIAAGLEPESPTPFQSFSEWETMEPGVARPCLDMLKLERIMADNPDCKRSCLRRHVPKRRWVAK